jgi:hypothetical protein
MSAMTLRLSEPMTSPLTSPMKMAGEAQPAAFKPFMRLVGADIEPTGAERRVFPRKQIDARVQGKRLDHSIHARREPFLNLSLRDESVGALAAVSQSAVAPGERVSVFFPPMGTKRGWDACGRVIRCDPGTFGYRIAVEFEAIPLAA